eukprot:CCRYP_008915-RA/>CCRYP_008915-RA protein AED:0.34 eAED:0.34 QI:0/0/0/1/0/0/2/0/185
MVKVDSWPGRSQEDFLAEARTLEFIVHPGVPNTTAVTQETDQNYGPFKTLFLKILRDVTVRNSQEQIGVICKATTEGNLFHATGGKHLTEIPLQKKVKAEIKQLKKKKDVSLKMGDVAAKANAILQQQKLYTTYTKGELSVLLIYHQVKGISGMKKDVMVSKWKHILESKKAAPACDCWSDEDER